MPTRNSRYDSVNSAWPATLPPLASDEATRAANKLVRHFYTKAITKPQRSWIHPSYGKQARRCWVSCTPTTGHNKGWGRLVHDVSHVVHAYLSPDVRPHSGGHAYLEGEMVAYVLAKGWLSGALKTKPRDEPTRDSLNQARLVSLDARIKRLTTTLKRSTTLLKKATQQRRRLAQRNS